MGAVATLPPFYLFPSLTEGDQASTPNGSFGAFFIYLILVSNDDDDDRVYNVVFGFFQAPYYAFSQTMMAELTPPGFDYMV